MDLSKIISVAGKSGLYRVLAQGRQALIVESLIDKKRIPVPLTMRVSSLDEISMFTTGDDIELKEVLKKVHALENGAASIDPKSPESELMARFKKAIPDYDPERVHASDVRKLFTWYALLLQAGEFDRPEEGEADDKKEEEKVAAADKGPETIKKVKSAAKGPKKATTKKPAPARSTAVRKGSQRGG